MDKRALLNLGLMAVVAGLGALYWFDREPPAEDADQPLVFPALASATRLAVLERDPAGGERPRWALEKRAEGWWLVAPFESATDPIAIEDLLKYLGGVRSRARYAATELDPATTGLAAPGSAFVVTAGGVETRHELGGTESLNYRRYLKVGDAVHLVDDLISYRLQQDAANLASKRLLPAGAEVVAVALPGRRAARDAAGRWTLAPEDPEVSADALVALAANWARATALSVAKADGGRVQATIEVALAGAPTPLAFDVLTADDELRLARRDLGLEYRLPATARSELLQLPRTVAVPGDAPAAAPAPTPATKP